MSTFPCQACGKVLSVASFSKKQVNKFEHGHSTSLTCTACIQQRLDAELALSGSGGKKGRKGESATPAVADSSSSSSPSSSSSQQQDPSLKYISNPFQAPLIKNAKAHFKHIFQQDLPIYLKDRVGWRTHVKMAVRATILRQTNSTPVDQSSSASSSGHTSTTLTTTTTTTKECLQTRIGLFKPGSHDVIECLAAPAHHPAINSALQHIHSCLQSQRLHGYLEGHEYDREECRRRSSYVKYLVLSVHRSTSAVQLTIVWNAPKEDRYATKLAASFVQHLTRHSSGDVIFHSIWVNHHVTSKHDNTITGRNRDDWELCFGEEYLLEQCSIYPPSQTSLSPLRLHFLPFVFRQANMDAFEGIILKMRESLATGLKCLELYGGIGTIGLHLLDKLDVLHCSDENPFNQICFERSRAMIAVDPNKVKYFPFSAEKMVAREDVRFNLWNSAPSNASFYDLVIVDPPRKGLDLSVAQALIQAPPETSIASSGNFPSAAVRGKKTRFDDAFSSEDNISSKETENTNPLSSKSSPISQGDRRRQQLVYVSCGFEALKKDLALLTNVASHSAHAPDTSGRKRSRKEAALHPSEYERDVLDTRKAYWKLVAVYGFVLFPGADHLETLAILERAL